MSPNVDVMLTKTQLIHNSGRLRQQSNQRSRAGNARLSLAEKFASLWNSLLFRVEVGVEVGFSSSQ